MLPKHFLVVLQHRVGRAEQLASEVDSPNRLFKRPNRQVCAIPRVYRTKVSFNLTQR
mgnify:CR=1 FL=1